jgi:hypothetical protein
MKADDTQPGDAWSDSATRYQAHEAAHALTVTVCPLCKSRRTAESELGFDRTCGVPITRPESTTPAGIAGVGGVEASAIGEP